MAWMYSMEQWQKLYVWKVSNVQRSAMLVGSTNKIARRGKHSCCVQEDPWNSIGAGFLTGGFLQLRTGPRSALQSAVFGGVLLVNPPKIPDRVAAEAQHL